MSHAHERIGRTIDARTDRPEEIAEEVAAVVFAGGTVIFPTDTSYALGCDPCRSAAVDRVYVALGRPDHRPLTVHVATSAEFLEYAGDNQLAVLVAKRFLPGPLIVLVKKPSFVSDDLTAGLQTVAFRVPDDPLVRELLERCGPLAGTTANPRGGARYAGGDDRSMLPAADLLVEHGPTRYDTESTILDLTGTHARLLREGAVPQSRLAELLGPIERPTVKVRTQHA
ncbi:MAG: threonylcarbamoyl-AMP synthase [Candidatus Eremiobacteraeota bacterium]|nr:threonylcarbamoyl-AMP synthase [Candidatus Eremiobacteraeota bacterium]MBV8655538.1 threonylcarbamoyl-AMP synthase [Candidatus Eremiobacteraeota bacterium]